MLSGYNLRPYKILLITSPFWVKVIEYSYQYYIPRFYLLRLDFSVLTAIMCNTKIENILGIKTEVTKIKSENYSKLLITVLSGVFNGVNVGLVPLLLTWNKLQFNLQLLLLNQTGNLVIVF